MKSCSRIRSIDGYLGERLQAMWRGNLLALDWQRDFLAPFREKSRDGGYIGLGKTLSGLTNTARLFDGEAGDLRARIVGDLLSTQDADGYVGLLAEPSRTARLWDVHEQSYIIQALLESWSWFGDRDARQGAERLGRWLLPRLADGRWRAVDDGRIWLPLALIGLDRAMLRLAEATGDRTFADFARHDLGVADWFDPIVEGRQGSVAGHAYAYLARCLAQLEMLGDEDPLPPTTRAALGYLLAGGGLVVSGSCGQEECWHCSQRVDGKLGETCTTAYLIRWAAHLLRRTGESLYGDLIERAMYNALFAANSPDGRRIRYYSAASGPRKWYEVDTYCCPGNYRRIIGELPDHIAHCTDAELTFNLYEACSLEATVAGVGVIARVDTAYPFDGDVAIRLEPERASTFAVRLRLPGWAGETAILCNGEAVEARCGNGWAVLERQWQQGDRIELSFAMPWRSVRGCRDQQDRVAVMRGPVVWGAAAADHADAQLDDVVVDVESCRLMPDQRQAQASGAAGDRSLDVRLTPFSDPEVTTTYFRAHAGAGDEPDHLLWLAADPVGTGPAPGA